MNNKLEMATLVEQVIDAIETGIRKGRYTPGDQLVERELAKELGVSRIPVREALRRLAAQHILEIRPYRGAIVRKLSRQEAIDVIDILNALGLYAVRRATELINEKGHHKRLTAFITKKASTNKREKKIKEWVDINFPFFQLIAELSGNPLVPDLLKQYQLQMYRLVWDVKLAPGSKSSTMEDHKTLANAILDGDLKKALKAYDQLHEHVMGTIASMPDSAFAPELD